jgi:UDP-N-acetylmuramate--alanine ligase
VVTNVEADHLDNWGTEEAYHQAFRDFLARLDPDGFLVACVDDLGAAALAGEARSRGLRVLTVGESAEADLRASSLVFEGSTSSFDVAGPDGPLGRVTLQIPGRHYVLDALCALAAGLELGFAFDALAAGLSSYTGTRRRMERKGEVAGVRVYDSYAHHPKEIAGDLQAARALAGEGRLVVAYQPHLVSRTRLFGAQMGEALGAADEVVVLDVYLAREDPEPGVDGALVARHVPLPPDRVHVAPDRSAVPPLLVSLARPGDLVLTLGAGDVTELGPEVLRLLSALPGEEG